MTPLDVQARFAATGGLDPVFRTNDGSNSPTADVSTVGARRSAYSMLLGKAVIRVGIGIPAGAEFDLQAVDDPYHFASAQELSLFRRPLPSTNLGFLSTVMWDGRESTALTGTSPVTDMASLQADLGHQATDATNGHAQAAQPPTTDQVQQIVAFEMSLNTAQLRDKIAGSLTDAGATGGPAALAQQPFQIGMNDPLSPGGVSPHTFSVFAAWASLTGADATTQARQALARGETLFNTKPITISGVAGLNSPTGPASASFQGTCTTCHNTPNVGDHSSALPINIGISDASRRTPDMPVYTLRNKATGETVQTTDPGRALITGKWADIGKFKGPILRGLAARAPYFHNGSAASLDAVLDFYDTRFNIGLSQQEHRDLVAFLRAL
jgi:hypothetical protein